jgi:hypothetical protein
MERDIIKRAVTACKQYCLAAGATQGNIAYIRTVGSNNTGKQRKVRIPCQLKSE